MSTDKSELSNGKRRNVYIIDWMEEDCEVEDDGGEEEAEDGGMGDAQRVTDPPKELIIRGFGLDEKGNTVTVNVTGFQPFFFVKVPKWNKTMAARFVEQLKESAYFKYKSALVSHELIRGKSLYNFSGNHRDYFIRLVFKNKDAFHHYMYKFHDGNKTPKPLKLDGINRGDPDTYHTFESNIPPMLRFMHIRDLHSTGWLTVPKKKYIMVSPDDKVSSSSYEMSVHYKSVSPVNDLAAPPLVVAAFDIEANSAHGDFPIPDKNYQKLARDIITEYISLAKAKDPYIECRPRELIRTWLEIAFNQCYNNNNISALSAIRDTGIETITLTTDDETRLHKLATYITRDGVSDKRRTRYVKEFVDNI